MFWNGDKVNPVPFKWKWGEDDLPIYVPWRRDLKGLLLDAHIANVIGNGK